MNLGPPEYLIPPELIKKARILHRKGTKTELDTIILNTSEIGFTTDTKEVYIGDGTENILIGRPIIDEIGNRPPAAVYGRMFLATDQGNILYFDDGVQWLTLGVIPHAHTHEPGGSDEIDFSTIINDTDDVIRDCAAATAVDDVVYPSNTTDNFIITNVDNRAERPSIGIVTAKPTTTTAVILIHGSFTSISGLSKGKRVYLGTNGAPSSILPSTGYVQILGQSHASNILFVKPSMQRVRRTPF